MCSYPLATTSSHLAIQQVELSEVRIGTHHHLKLVEYVTPGFVFNKGRYEVLQMPEHTMIVSTDDIRYNNSHRGGAFHIPEDAFPSSNSSIVQILSCIPSLCFNCLRCEYGFLQVYLIVF